jgi:hypothetical protein
MADLHRTQKQLAALRHEERDAKRAVHERGFAQHRAPPLHWSPGDLVWVALPRDSLKGSATAKKLCWFGPYVVELHDRTNDRVTVCLHETSGERQSPIIARLTVHVRATRAYESPKMFDDPIVVDGEIVQHWSTSHAPLGGLDAVPADVTKQIKALAARKTRAGQQQRQAPRAPPAVAGSGSSSDDETESSEASEDDTASSASIVGAGLAVTIQGIAYASRSGGGGEVTMKMADGRVRNIPLGDVKLMSPEVREKVRVFQEAQRQSRRARRDVRQGEEL